MKSSVLLSMVIGGLLAIPAVASAQDQPWLKDRRYTEGPGYRVGDFELHPGAALEFGYDSNYLRRSGNAADMPSCAAVYPNNTYPDCHDVLGSLRARFTPSLSFSTLSPQRRETAPSTSQPSVEFRGGLSATINGLIPIQGSGPAKDAIKSATNVGITSDLQLSILPGRPWSGVLTASYTRINQAGEDGASQIFNSQGSLNRDVPTGAAELVWTPGAGLLEWRLGYQFVGTLFEDSNLASALSNLNNTIETRGRWRFLPRTSLVYDAKFGFINYLNGSTPPNAAGFLKTSSHPLRTLIGINGLVTPSFAVLAMVGWGASFYSAAPNNPSQNFDSVIGQAEVKWFLTPNPSVEPTAASLTLSSISVGFLRDFYDSYISTYFERDRPYLTLSYFYGGRFLVVLDGGAGPLIYPPTPMVKTGGPFTMIRADASLFGEWRFKDAWGINATIRYNENFGDTAISNGNVTSHLSYREIEAYLGARWLM
jgi:hypothetical protein